MSSIYLMSAAEDMLHAVGRDAKAALAADLQTLADGPGVALTVDGTEYKAALLEDGWVAVYRELQPGEPGAKPGEKTIAVMDLLRPDPVGAASGPGAVAAK